MQLAIASCLQSWCYHHYSATLTQPCPSSDLLPQVPSLPGKRILSLVRSMYSLRGRTFSQEGDIWQSRHLVLVVSQPEVVYFCELDKIPRPDLKTWPIHGIPRRTDPNYQMVLLLAAFSLWNKVKTVNNEFYFCNYVVLLSRIRSKAYLTNIKIFYNS